MPRKVENVGWVCNICNTIYSKELSAYGCEKSHNIIYVGFNRDDLHRLIQYIYTGDRELLSKSLVDTLLKYRSQMKGLDTKK